MQSASSATVHTLIVSVLCDGKYHVDASHCNTAVKDDAGGRLECTGSNLTMCSEITYRLTISAVPIRTAHCDDATTLVTMATMAVVLMAVIPMAGDGGGDGVDGSDGGDASH